MLRAGEMTQPLRVLLAALPEDPRSISSIYVAHKLTNSGLSMDITLICGEQSYMQTKYLTVLTK